MIDFNKKMNVIKRMEECLSASCRGFKPGIYCPWPDEVWDCIEDALAMLKAEIPHVMMLNEMIGSMLSCTPVFIERRSDEDKEPGDDRWVMLTPKSENANDDFIFAYSTFITREMFFRDEYGKTWRCWTSKPTKEMMEDTSWSE